MKQGFGKSNVGYLEDRLFRGEKIVWAGRGWYRCEYSVWRKMPKLDHDDPRPLVYIEDAATTRYESLG